MNGNGHLKTITEPLALKEPPFLPIIPSSGPPLAAHRGTGGVSKPALSPVEGGARWRKSTVSCARGLHSVACSRAGEFE